MRTQVVWHDILLDLVWVLQALHLLEVDRYVVVLHGFERLLAIVLVASAGQVFPIIFLVKFLSDDVEVVPDVSVVDLLEGVELAVVGATISVDLRIRILLESSSHHPLAVHEAAIPKQ